MRTQIHTATSPVIIKPAKILSPGRETKKKTKNTDIKKILAYSAIKIKANPTAPYSTLNPDTSSDSPSAKSKGVRLVSARQEINHMPTNGIKINNKGKNFLLALKK